MCLDAMVTEERKQREVRSGWWRRRRSGNTGGVRKGFRKSPRKPRRNCSTRGSGKEQGLPSGAMAPRNTTQYLMELVYRELSASELSSSSSSSSSRWNNFPDQDTMDFQHRDFETVFFHNEI